MLHRHVDSRGVAEWDISETNSLPQLPAIDPFAHGDNGSHAFVTADMWRIAVQHVIALAAVDISEIQPGGPHTHLHRTRRYRWRRQLKIFEHVRPAKMFKR
ncbi:hypothetical protein D3C73_1080160 [compost metagenome]